MGVKKQDVLDVLDTLGVIASKRHCWNIGMGEVLSAIQADIKSGQLQVYRFKGEGVPDDSEVELVVTEITHRDLPYAR